MRIRSVRLSQDDSGLIYQCGEGTKVCLTLLNHKESAPDPNRITAVIPLWYTDTPDEDVTITALGKNGQDGIKIYVAGPDYAG